MMEIIFMKLKAITMILMILLFISGMSECIMIFMGLEIPTAMTAITIILLFICSMSEFMRTRRLKKLGYPLIIIYFLVGLPNIEKFINNKVLSTGFVVLGFIVTIIFIYNELIIIKKEKHVIH
jgi:hypothetical protein